MYRKISLFNHKGGVSKTTTAFNLGWILAEQGKTVILVDADPQCNLTGMVLGCDTNELAQFYQNHPERNIKAALAPAFESRPVMVKPIECLPVPGREGLVLLPGHIRLSEYEVTLGMAQQLSESLQALQNIPGSIPYLFEETARQVGADFVIIDMNPSLSSMNQNILMTSDYFIVPTGPDYFSLMALHSLATILPSWKAWAERFAAKSSNVESTYPLPLSTTKFLGTIVQRYRPRNGVPAAAFQRWIDEINGEATNVLFPALEQANMTLDEPVYSRFGVQGNQFCLSSIPDFNSLIARSQDHQTPIFALSEEQLGAGGQVLENTIASRDAFRGIFEDLAQKVIGLTEC